MTASDPPTPNVLTIAGSDPSGGAGIQADLKTFFALGAYGMAALTALTAQNTRGVKGVSPVDPAFLRSQIEAIFADIRVDAVKVGMVGSAASVAVVADCVSRYAPEWVVVDPVMVAKSGDRLVADEAVAALRELLLPCASLITPNLPEAAVLLGDADSPQDEAAIQAAGERLRALGPGAALMKAGHLEHPRACDVLVDQAGATAVDAPRVATRNSHGTGCTLASALGALLPQASDLASATRGAKRYLTEALEAADRLDVGQGHGPVHHGVRAWAQEPAATLLAAGTPR